MKNSKGFTIPELLLVIVIIGVLAVMAVGTYTGVSNRIKEKTLEQKLNYYKEKAYEYANDNIANESTFTLNQLVNLGYIDVDYVENPEYEKIDNPVTGGFLDCMSFTAIKNLTDYDITYNLDSNCDLAINEDRQEEVEVERYIKKDNEYIKIEDEWVNEPVYLFVRLLNYNKYEIVDNIINFNDYTNLNNDKEYCDTIKDLEDPENNCYNFYKVDTDYIYNNDFVISMNISDKFDDIGKTYRISKNIKVKIDKEKPKLKVNYNNAYTKEDFKIEAIGSDGLGSGVMGYYIGREKLSDDTYFSKDNFKETNGNGIYYAYIKDNAGNISDEVEIKIDNIADEGPKAIYFETNNRWTNKDFTFTFGCDSKETKVGCKNTITYSITDLSNNKVLVDNVTEAVSKITYTFHVDEGQSLEKIALTYKITDNIGNEKSFENVVNYVRIDKVAADLEISHNVYQRKGGLFNLFYEGADYVLTIVPKNNVPSGINESKYGYSTSNTNPNNYTYLTEAQLDEIFSHKGKGYSIYVEKRSTKDVAARVVSNSGQASYGVIALAGNGCTKFAAWAYVGSLIYTIYAPGLGLIGAIVGWQLCNAN